MEIIPFKEWLPEKIKEWQQETSKIDYKKDMTVGNVLVYNKLASSKSDARRLIEGKAVKLNGRTIQSSDELIEVGELNVGKLKMMSLGSYMRIHLLTCSNGSVSIEVSPLLQNLKQQAMADGLARAAEYMENKGYISVSSELNTEKLSSHFASLIDDNLINFEEDRHGILNIDVSIGKYLKPIKEVKEYVKNRDSIIKKLKEASVNDLMLSKFDCPQCGENMFRGSYNNGPWKDKDKKYNINGVCDNCDFKINELA